MGNQHVKMKDGHLDFHLRSILLLTLLLMGRTGHVVADLLMEIIYFKAMRTGGHLTIQYIQDLLDFMALHPVDIKNTRQRERQRLILLLLLPTITNFGPQHLWKLGKRCKKTGTGIQSFMWVQRTLGCRKLKDRLAEKSFKRRL